MLTRDVCGRFAWYRVSVSPAAVGAFRVTVAHYDGDRLVPALDHCERARSAGALFRTYCDLYAS